MTTHGFSAEGFLPEYHRFDTLFYFKDWWLECALKDIKSNYQRRSSPMHEEIVPKALEALSVTLKLAYSFDLENLSCTAEILSDPKFQDSGSPLIPDYTTIFLGVAEALDREGNKKNISQKARESFYKQSARELEGIVSLVREKKPLLPEQLNTFRRFVNNFPWHEPRNF